jgi:hypothetical protein
MAAFIEWLKTWILQVLAVGGTSTVIAYGLFQWFGKRWIEQKFQSQLEKLKHLHQRELEGVKHEIQKTYSRVSKVHEREFEVLPRAWFMLHEAIGMAAHAAGLFIRGIPDFAMMSDEQFEDFLAGQKRFSEHNKNELRQAQDRTAYYKKLVAALDLDAANDKQRLLNNYLIESQIFMNKELQQQFETLSHELALGLTEFSSIDRKLALEGINRISELHKKMPDLAKALQKRLHYDEA